MLIALLEIEPSALRDKTAPVTSHEPHDAAAILGPPLGEMCLAGGFVGRFGDRRVEAEPGDDAVHGGEPAG